MARAVNMESMEQKIEKAQKEVVRTKKAYDAATSKLKELLDKRDALKKEQIFAAIANSSKSLDEILRFIQEQPEEAEE